MQREPVTVSRFARSFGYDPDSNTLEVEHKKGSVWQFSPIEYSVYIGLKFANNSVKHGPESFDGHFKKFVWNSGCKRQRIA